MIFNSFKMSLSKHAAMTFLIPRRLECALQGDIFHLRIMGPIRPAWANVLRTWSRGQNFYAAATAVKLVWRVESILIIQFV